MSASAAHVTANERRMANSSSAPGYAFTETPATPDDVSVDWTGHTARGLP
jgi:hypothetical protein